MSTKVVQARVDPEQGQEISGSRTPGRQISRLVESEGHFMV